VWQGGSLLYSSSGPSLLAGTQTGTRAGRGEWGRGWEDDLGAYGEPDTSRRHDGGLFGASPARVHGEDKAEAPPVTSLYDMVKPPTEEDSPAYQPVATPQAPPYPFLRTPFAERPRMEVPEESYKGDESTWVTVFGFPPSQTANILKYFQTCGEIVRHHVGAANCNWIHIQFQTALQAKKALSKNGKNIGGNLMVGVVPLDESELEAPTPRVAFPRPLNPPSHSKPGRGYRVELFGPKRPPTAEDSFWSKFMEYVIGA